MELIIEGSERRIKEISKMLRLHVKKRKLKMSIIEEKEVEKKRGRKPKAKSE